MKEYRVTIRDEGSMTRKVVMVPGSIGKRNVPKEILLIVRWPGGGIRTFIRYVYHNIDRSRWHLTILAPQSEGLNQLREDLAETDSCFIPVAGIPNDGSSGALVFTKQIVKILRERKFDLVHSHGFISGACAAFPAFLKRLPHIMTSHDVMNKSQFLGIKGIIKKNALGAAFRLIDKIQSVSYGAHDNLIENFPNLNRNNKCVVILNGIEIKRFVEAVPRNLRAENKIGDDVYLIGFLGRFMAQKGFRYLVDAIELLRRLELPRKPVVMTFGDGCFASQDKEMIKNRGLEGYFRFMPFTPNVAGTIKGLDLIAMPSLWEACPLQPMEALVCGTPFIGTDCVGLYEVLIDTPAAIVPKADAFRLSNAIAYEMKNNRNDVFFKFKKKAAHRFDVFQTRTNLFKLYKELIID